GNGSEYAAGRAGPAAAHGCVGGSPAPAHAGIQREAARVRKRDEPTIPTPPRDDPEPRAGAGADGGHRGGEGRLLPRGATCPRPWDERRGRAPLSTRADLLGIGGGGQVNLPDGSDPHGYKWLKRPPASGRGRWSAEMTLSSHWGRRRF